MIRTGSFPQGLAVRQVLPSLVALAIVAAGCGGGSKGSADGPIVMNQILASASSAFEAAQSGEDAVVVLAKKDRYGNPLAITGVAFFAGDQSIRYEVDATGRPRSITTPTTQLLFGDYTEAAVHVDSTDAAGTHLSAEVSFNAADLESVRVVPPSLVFTQKSASSTAVELANFADTMKKVYECVHSAFLGNVLAAIGKTVLHCADLSLSVAAEQRIGRLLLALNAGVSAAECVGYVSAYVTTEGVLIPALLEAAVACPAAYKAFEEALDVKPDPRPFDGQEYSLLASGSLTEDRPGFVTITLVSATGSVPTTSAVVDLREIGGLSAQPLENRGGMWTWSGTVTPKEPYSRDLYLTVDGQSYGFGGAIDVAPATPPGQLTLALHPSKTTIAPGEAVQIVADVTNGVTPYKSAWVIDGVAGPENVLAISDHPTKTTVYAFGVEDSSPDFKRFTHDQVTITVCDPNQGACQPPSITDMPIPATPQEGCGVVRDCADPTWPAPPACVSPTCAGDPRGAEGAALGDPHLRTFDGLAYDFQAVGEFTLAASTVDDFEIQNRTKPWNTRTDVAVNTAVAARVAGHRVNIVSDGTTRVDGTPLDVGAGGTTLPGGGQLFRLGAAYTVVWPDGSQLRTHPRGDFLEVEVFLSTARAGTMIGLLGNYDHMLAGELATRAGLIVPKDAAFEVFYGTYAESWRIAQDGSLFDYGPGETTETFTDRSFPKTRARTADLQQPQKDAAAATCAQAGVTDLTWLDACVLDVALTGDPRFAEGLARAAPPAGMGVPPLPDLCTNISGAGGAITSHCSTGTITSAQTVSLTFDATAGSGIIIRAVDVTATSYVPAFSISDPSGAKVATASGYDVASAAFTATSSGTYTVVLSGGSAAGDAYKVYLTVAPGSNTGGALVPGGVKTAHLYEGALDSYTFPAQIGEGIILRVTDLGAGAFVPAFYVYGPTGDRVTTASGYDVASTAFAAASAGTYTVVVYDASGGAAATADYKVYFTKAPGSNKGGALPPGGVISAHLDEGALDSYTFAAQTGEGIILRVVDLNAGAFVPAFYVYGPAGDRVTTASGYDVASTAFAAASAGTYTVVVYDASGGAAATADYKVYFTKAPGSNKGGALPPGGVVSAHLDEGALDSYTFAAQAGEGIILRVVDVSAGAFVPAFYVYGPTGDRVTTASGYDVASTAFSAGSAGTYTIVVYDASGGAAAVADYKVYFTKAPGSNKGGPLISGVAVSAHLDEGALDSYTLAAQVGQGIVLTVTDVAAGPLVPAFYVYGPSGERVTSASGYDVATGTLKPAATGVYTIVVYDASGGAASMGDYTLLATQTPNP